MQTIVVTGANTGIGAAFAREIAGPDMQLWLCCRSEEKTEPVLRDLRARGADARFLELDLGDLVSTKRAASKLAAVVPRIDRLINNAGVAGVRGVTKQGFEVAFGTNHLGHFAFTRPLLPALTAARGRIVNVSSGNHYRVDGIDLGEIRRSTRSRTGLPEYSVSKLANVLFTAELARRFPSIEAVSVHPGRIASDIWRQVPKPFRRVLPWLLRMGSVEQGGHTLTNAVRVPLSPETLYLDRLRVREPNALARDAAMATSLWEFSEVACDSVSLMTPTDPSASVDDAGSVPSGALPTSGPGDSVAISA